jgi:hypothetical protein
VKWPTFHGLPSKEAAGPALMGRVVLEDLRRIRCDGFDDISDRDVLLNALHLGVARELHRIRAKSVLDLAKDRVEVRRLEHSVTTEAYHDANIGPTRPLRNQFQ